VARIGEEVEKWGEVVLAPSLIKPVGTQDIDDQKYGKVEGISIFAAGRGKGEIWREWFVRLREN
jgi:hypothetical protein